MGGNGQSFMWTRKRLVHCWPGRELDCRLQVGWKWVWLGTLSRPWGRLHLPSGEMKAQTKSFLFGTPFFQVTEENEW